MNKICRFLKTLQKRLYISRGNCILCTASNSSYGNDAVYHAYSQVV